MKFSSTFVCAAITLLSAGVDAMPTRRGDGFVTAPCRKDSDCQQGCCAFNTGKCAGPAIAQTRDGGCGFGSGAPNCNVAAALKLNSCVAGAKNGDLGSPEIQAAARFVSKLDNIPLPPPPAGGSFQAAPPPPPPAAAPAGNGQGFVTAPCKKDSDCQQGCCAFNTGKCAGPAIAQTRDGGCGFGSPAPNCNVAAALKLNSCVAGAKNGNLASPEIQAAAAFVSKLDGIPLPPAPAGGSFQAAAPPPPPPAAAPVGNAQGFVTSPCKQDSDCQQGCCAFNTGKCAGPAIAQTRDGGCGFGSGAPNCNVAALLKLNSCAAGAKNGDLSNPTIVAAARFVSKLDNIPFSG